MSDLAKRLNIMADWFDQDPDHAYKNTIALLREAASALEAAITSESAMSGKLIERSKGKNSSGYSPAGEAIRHNPCDDDHTAERSSETCGAAPTPSHLEQLASAKPQDEAEMVLAKIKTLLNLPASILDSNDRAALAELRTYAATERAHARKEAMEEAAKIADTFTCGGCGMDGKTGAAIRSISPPLQRNDAGGGEGWIEWHGGKCPVAEGTIIDVKCRNGTTTLNSHAWGWFWKHEGYPGDIIAYRPVSPPTAAPDPLDRPVTWRDLIVAMRKTYGRMSRIAVALERSALSTEER